MKKVLAVAALLMFSISLKAGAEGFFFPTEIWGSIAFGGLQSGFQMDLPNQTLLPPPDECTALLPIIGIRRYVAGPLGFEASFAIGSTTANWDQFYSALTMYNFEMANLGLIPRYAFRSAGGSSAFAIFAGGGANYSFFSLSSSYTSLFSGVSFYDVLSDFGWYAKAGIAWYPSRNFFLDATGWYYLINAKMDVSGQKLDGTYFLFAMSIGFGF